jgi:hypothetical protein
MEKLPSSIPAQPVVRGASAFQGQLPDRVPNSVAIDLGDDTPVITLDEVVSPAEKTPSGAGAEAIQCGRFTGSLSPTLWPRCDSI